MGHHIPFCRLLPIWMAGVLSLLTGCSSKLDMDTESALSIVQTVVEDEVIKDYKPIEISWHSYSNTNMLNFVNLKLIGRDNAYYDYLVYFGLGKPEPKLKPALIRNFENRVYEQTRRIPFDSIIPLVLDNIHRAKACIPQENEFDGVNVYHLSLKMDNRLFHQLTLNLSGAGRRTLTPTHLWKRVPMRVDYRQLYGRMLEGDTLKVELEPLK